MIRLRRTLRLIWAFTNCWLQTDAQYRIGVLTWVVNGAITPLLMMAVWLVVGVKGNLAMSSTQIVTYYLSVLVIGRFTQVWSIGDLGEEIRDGSFSVKLLRPVHYFWGEIGRTLGLKFFRLFIVVILYLFLAFLAGQKFLINLSIDNALFLGLALIMGLVLRLFIENTFALLVFWLEEFESLEYLHGLVSDLLSGSLLPLALAPIFMKKIILFSPFRFYVSFPAEILLGQIDKSSLYLAFFLGIGYITLFYFGYRWLLGRAIKKYSAYGN